MLTVRNEIIIPMQRASLLVEVIGVSFPTVKHHWVQKNRLGRNASDVAHVRSILHFSDPLSLARSPAPEQNRSEQVHIPGFSVDWHSSISKDANHHKLLYLD